MNICPQARPFCDRNNYSKGRVFWMKNHHLFHILSRPVSGWLLGLTALLLIGAFFFTQMAAAAAGVREQTLRLHILAASDSPRDQLLKLKVRDEILASTQQLFAGAQSPQQARSLVRLALPAISKAANGALARAGSSQTAQVSLERFRFETTRYQGFSLPAGEYDALRVVIGEGEGHNWFCCLYPALCVGAASGRYQAPEENALVFGDYLVSFAALEWWENLCRGEEETH